MPRSARKPPKSAPKPSDQITVATPVATILAVLPEARELLAEYGLHCVGCSMNGVETIGEGCHGHGWPEENTNELIDDLNALLRSRPQRPMMLTLTLPAARAIRMIAEQEEKIGEILVVTVDESGGFCLEFAAESEASDLIFFHPEESDIRIAASPLTLGRIGGATIDAKDGRLKLDLPEEGECGCEEGEGCACKH